MPDDFEQIVKFKRDHPNTPVNLDQVAFADVEEISVNEWHRLPNGEGSPEQVHVWLKLKGLPYPFVIRFKRPGALDELITSLIVHRRGVFGGPPGVFGA